MGYKAAVLTISDKGFRGERVDTSGPALREMLMQAGYEVVHAAILPDERGQIAEALKQLAEVGVALVLTTGGTGFSPRDITPEATLDVIERQTPGLAETMRAESMRVTPRGCLSRGVAGIRNRTLIVNLPGSERAARENLTAILPALEHGLEMLMSAGSADCATPASSQRRETPSMDAWLAEAKAAPNAEQCGMYLCHNGVVRLTPKAQVRQGETGLPEVDHIEFSYDAEGVEAAIAETLKMDGIYHVRVWLNEGVVNVGDSIMFVLIGGDIRPRVIDALQSLVGTIKNELVVEKEIYVD